MVVVRCDAVRFQSLFILKWYLKGDKKRTHRISNVAEKNKFNKDAKLGKNGHRVFSRKIQQPTHSAIAFGSKCPFLMITVHIHILLVYKICCCSFHIVHMVFGIFSSNFYFVRFLRSLQTDPFNWDKQILVILISWQSFSLQSQTNVFSKWILFLN